MKFIAILLYVLPEILAAQYKVTDNKSSLQFTISNFGINVNGTFKGFDGTITFDPEHLPQSFFKVSIDAASVNTDNNLRDSHLRKETYFNTAQYPRIYFESTEITNSTRKGVFFILGKLTIKNHSKEISFPFTADPSGNGYLFKGTFSINRKDFEVGGTSIISNTAEISLSVWAEK